MLYGHPPSHLISRVPTMKGERPGYQGSEEALEPNEGFETASLSVC